MIVYSTPGCPMCEMLKDKLHTLNIDFTEINDSAILAEKHIVHVPVIEKDGVFYSLKNSLKLIEEGKLL